MVFHTIRIAQKKSKAYVKNFTFEDISKIFSERIFIFHRNKSKKRAIRLSRHQIALSPVKSKLHYITSLSAISFVSTMDLYLSMDLSSFNWLFYNDKLCQKRLLSYFSIGLTSCSYLTKEDFLFCFLSSFVVFIVLHFK